MAAGVMNTTGIGNVYIGAGSCMGSGTTTGSSRNTFLGAFTGPNASGDSEEIGSGNVFIGYNVGSRETGNDKLMIDNTDSSTSLIWGDFANDRLKFNGKVGIGYGFSNYPSTSGTVNVSNYNLFVKGGILTEQVRVTLQSTWADYVFKKDYRLPTLTEVENHIATKGHLINVPSAEEVKNNGIELGEMSKIQQEKIEELTLYVIEQNKINEKQAKEIKELKALVSKLIEKDSARK
ncbi:hypothetical protein NAT51_11025 [Flavobacterium amniphilum]|uniref:hypothetical protein n=1 Tax=Flavobacterium amniphilum TaxID=1834035 RepID=UPI00202A73C5|nr:hypothetical protein [Flavobacterium amniphilum]MCL9806060.1 hypothetical protein [Flavobacterium amniphilum]